MNHPARHALVELVNVHDEGLAFEPIHRVVMKPHANALLEGMIVWFRNAGAECSLEEFDNHAEALAQLEPAEPNTHRFTFLAQRRCGVVSVKGYPQTLAVGTLQNYLDAYLEANADAEIDYIHGAEIVAELGSKANCVGFCLPGMEKSDLFKSVIHEGALPRKTFSMGEAEEKRYYLECRRIQD